MTTETTSRKGTILISQKNVNTGIVLKAEKLIHSDGFWHKVYVQNGAEYERDYVLGAIAIALQPHELAPINYSYEGKNVSFLLRDCGHVIKKLCLLNLFVTHPKCSSEKVFPFKLAILLKFAHASDMKYDLYFNMAQTIKKRYDTIYKTMDLNCFVDDSDLLGLCPLSHEKLAHYVIYAVREYTVKTLLLRNNKLSVLEPLLILKGLTRIDLSYNNISDPQELKVLQNFKITELVLEENPICKDLHPSKYLEIVNTYCPGIKKLDGLDIPPDKFLTPNKNYLCKLESAGIIDQFLEHFFTQYDSSSRKSLASMYSVKATFSISSHFISGQSTSVAADLQPYIKLSRNIKKINDLSKSGDNLYIGRNKIMQVFCSLPSTLHDPYSFNVDLMFNTEKLLILTVSGVFKETSAESKNFSFYRTFSLLSSVNSEYMVTNDQLHVSNATTQQHLNAFKFSMTKNARFDPIPIERNVVDTEEMVKGMSQMTNLKVDWAKKCLQETKYDFHRAVLLFMDLYKSDQLPARAFMDILVDEGVNMDI